MANKANSVKKYIVAEDGTLVQKGYYLEAALSWERITDEDNNVTDIYTNLLGQKVFERHVMTQGMVDTYFVSRHYAYDGLGRMTAQALYQGNAIYGIEQRNY